MICTNCNHENAPDFLFCEKCGEPLRKECPECGHANALDFAFCENCGHKFAAEAAYVPASEELVQPAPPAKSPPKRKQKASSIPASEETVPAQEAPPPQVVVIQQEKSRGLPGWLWLVLVLIIAAIFFVIIGPRQPDIPPSVSSVGQSSGSGDTGSAGQSSAGSGDTGSGTQPTDTPRPPDTENSLGPAEFTVDQETNCRYGPSSSSFDVRRTIFDGQTVPIVGRGAAPAHEWWVVEVDGVQCWVWSGLGEASGDTAGLASINPPPVPVAEQPVTEPDEDQDAKAEEEKDECQGLNPMVLVDPWSGPTGPDNWFGFHISGFAPYDHITVYILSIPDEHEEHFGEYDAYENGEKDWALSWDIGGPDPGQYEVRVYSTCTDDGPISASAVFIIE